MTRSKVLAQTHEIWSWNWLEHLIQDVRYTLRQLGRPAEALVDHERALVLRPGFAEAFDDRAKQLLGDGEIEQHVAAGMAVALRALQQRRREDALKLKALRMHIRAGIDALKQGDLIEIDDSFLDDYLEGLMALHDRGAS